MLLELKSLHGNKNKFICFFDSGDDLPIANSATVKIGVNPKSNISRYQDFDLILRSKTDPWKEFYKIL